MRPALNLALDEALLWSGAETLRLYGWEPAGLSIGFFQRADEFASLDGYELVRRPTGGGAIAHTGELTVARIGRGKAVNTVYERLNTLILTAGQILGAGPLSAGEGTPKPAPTGYCFDQTTCYDLLGGGGKLFGSAQRRSRNRYLVHGTLVLSKNPLSSGAGSIEVAAGRVIGRAEAEDAVIEAFLSLGGAELEPENPSDREWADAHQLVSERYGCESWTFRR